MYEGLLIKKISTQMASKRLKPNIVWARSVKIEVGLERGFRCFSLVSASAFASGQ